MKFQKSFRTFETNQAQDIIYKEQTSLTSNHHHGDINPLLLIWTYVIHHTAEKGNITQQRKGGQNNIYYQTKRVSFTAYQQFVRASCICMPLCVI